MKVNTLNKIALKHAKLLLLLCVLGLWSVSKGAYASQQLSQFTALKVQAAHQLQQKNELDQAIALLEQLKITRAYDKVFVQRMLGIFYWQKDNSDKAIFNLTAALSSGLLTGELAWNTQRMLADILLSQLNYSAALTHYSQLLTRISSLLPAEQQQQREQLWLRIAQTHYQLKQWQQTLSALASYQSLLPPSALNKDELQYLTLKLAAQRQLKSWKSALLTLDRLLQLQPNKTGWWQQMASMQLRLGYEQDSLNTLALARHQGVELTEQDLKTLAQLYARAGIPERAALIMAELIGADKNAELLVQQAVYWQTAKEWQNALMYWQKAAALDNKHSWPFAQLLLQQGDYHDALIALDNAAKLTETAEIHLAKVHAYYQLKDFTNALKHAKKALQLSETAATQDWIKYLQTMQKQAS